MDLNLSVDSKQPSSPGISRSLEGLWLEWTSGDVSDLRRSQGGWCENRCAGPWSNGKSQSGYRDSENGYRNGGYIFVASEWSFFWTWTVSKSQIVWYNILYMYRYVPIIIFVLYTYIYLYFIYIYIYLFIYLFLCVTLVLKEKWGKTTDIQTGICNLVHGEPRKR